MRKRFILLFALLLTSCLWWPIEPESIHIPNDTNITETKIMNIEEKLEIPKKIIEKKETCLIFDDFLDTSINKWVMVNDWVMWWKSIWAYDVEKWAFTLSGIINTNGGGFSSVRTGLSEWVLSDYDFIKITAKSDSRKYQVTFRDNNRRWVSHRAIIPFQSSNQFEEITIPIIELEPVFFWRSVKAAPFDKENAREIGFIISDWIDWKFSLEVRLIEFCK